MDCDCWSQAPEAGLQAAATLAMTGNADTESAGKLAMPLHSNLGRHTGNTVMIDIVDAIL